MRLYKNKYTANFLQKMKNILILILLLFCSCGQNELSIRYLEDFNEREGSRFTNCNDFFDIPDKDNIVLQNYTYKDGVLKTSLILLVPEDADYKIDYNFMNNTLLLKLKRVDKNLYGAYLYARFDINLEIEGGKKVEELVLQLLSTTNED